jgi:hypothetical protein
VKVRTGDDADTTDIIKEDFTEEEFFKIKFKIKDDAITTLTSI